jgi:hypothetical protein
MSASDVQQTSGIVSQVPIAASPSTEEVGAGPIR